MKKSWKFFEIVIVLLSGVACLFSIFILFIREDLFYSENRIFIVMLIVVLMEFIIAYSVTIYVRNRDKNNKEFADIEKLIRYDKKRRELDEEISYLTKQLMNSDAARYIDINRLVFSGQREGKDDQIIDFNNFLERFGIKKENAKQKENTAIFLSPFNEEGDIAFFACQRILNKIQIYLQRSDNIVKKDDILMNIIELILQSEWVIADITDRNPNVYYELGIAHTIGKKTILISKVTISKDNLDIENIGFDIRQKKIIVYRDENELEKELLIEFNRLKRNDFL